MVASQRVHIWNNMPQFADLTGFRHDDKAQLDKYSSDPALTKSYQLPTTNSSVALHRLVLVFHGGEMLLAEEV